MKKKTQNKEKRWLRSTSCRWELEARKRGTFHPLLSSRELRFLLLLMRVATLPPRGDRPKNRERSRRKGSQAHSPACPLHCCGPRRHHLLPGPGGGPRIPKALPFQISLCQMTLHRKINLFLSSHLRACLLILEGEGERHNT